MAFPSWLKIVQEKNKAVLVRKIKQKSIDAGEMAASSVTVASLKLTRIIEQRDATAKILVVGDGAFSEQLSDYAIKMGRRLDCEIVALSVFDKHFQEQRDPGEGEKNHFMKRSEIGATKFADKATGCGVKFYQLAKFGAREDVVNQVVKEIAGIRYVLAEPTDADVDENSERVQLPALDTTGSKL